MAYLDNLFEWKFMPLQRSEWHVSKKVEKLKAGKRF